MSQLTIYQGLPGSGKSTHAADQIRLRAEEDINRRMLRINQDEIRKELGWTSWAEWDFKSQAEARVPQIKMQRIREALKRGRDVISDDTNLKTKYVEQLTSLAAECEATVSLYRMPTTLAECIRRDALREASVGEAVIRQMAGAWARELDPSNQPLIAPYQPPTQGARLAKGHEGVQKVVVCDLDGTASLFAAKGHRGPYDAEKCDEDDPNMAVYRVLWAMQRQDCHIVYLSGRYEKFRPQTNTFLARHAFPSVPMNRATSLFMRADGDSRIDWLVKGELFDRYVRPFYDVQLVLDDRDQVVKFWRGIGLPCFQVAEGNF